MLGEKTELGAAILYRVLSDCLTKRVAFEQKPKGREGVKLEVIWERTVLDRGNKHESPEVGARWLTEDKQGGWWEQSGERVGEAQVEAGARSPLDEMPWELAQLSDFHFNGITRPAL